jgi:hypothetical protein
MKVKLAEGRAIRDPVTRAMMRPEEVRDVPLTDYWRRRLRDGDIVSAEEARPQRREHERRREHGEHHGEGDTREPRGEQQGA